jgi:hypothetical protein
MNYILICIVILIILLISLCLICSNDRTIEMFDNNKYDVLIISAGGGGTTYFMDFLLKNTNLKINHKDDKDKLKHISVNRKKVLNNVNCDKIIYLYNDPLLAIKSHFRRNWAFDQLKKHGNPYKLKEENVQNLDSFFKNTEMNNKDLYGIKEQYDFYMNDSINKNILFINFNNISENKNKIAKFIGVDETIFDKFEIKSRNSNNKNNDSHIIKKIYKDLYDKIDTMDGKIRNF